jgi:chromosome partitioning protein
MKVVTFSIFKGGTAKTTSTVNTAAALAHRGKKVLVIDLDQQASATRYLDLDSEQLALPGSTPVCPYCSVS